MRRTIGHVVAVVAVMCGTPRALAGLAEYQAAVRSEPSLVSYYTFDNDTAAVTDTAAGGHNGTLAGSGTTFSTAADALGGTGKALSLNGSGWVNFGHVAAFDFRDPNTGEVPALVEMWIRPGKDPGTYGSNPALAGVRDGGEANTRWSMHLQNFMDGWGVYAGGQGYHPFSYKFNRDQWYHLVFEFAPQRGAVWIYANGLWIGTFYPNGLGTGVDLPFLLGASSSSEAEAFTGMIDEVAIYSDNLPDATIARHYELMSGFAAPTAPLSIVQNYRNAVNADNPIGYYSFEGDTTSVTDSQGGHSGALVQPADVAPAPIYWTNGFAGGQALGLDLTATGYVDMGPVPAFAFGSSGTVEAWVSPWPGLRYRDPGASGRPTILSCADDFDNTYYAMEMRPSDETFGVEASPNGYTGAGVPGGLPLAEQWYHVAAVFDAGKVDYYINGQPTIAQAILPLTAPNPFNGNFQIGAVDPQGDWGFMGKIDEVAVYRTALTAQQVAGHYAGAAMTFSVHEHTFINPSDMAPIDMTLSAPTGQSAPAGLQLTFTYDTSVIALTANLPPPIGSTPIPSGTPLTLPAAGITSVPLTVTPVNGGYGTTRLTVAADPSSGWIYGDSATFSVLLADQGLIIVNDDFDDENIGTNTDKPGGGFWQFFNGKTPNETDTFWNVAADGGWFNSAGIYSKSAGNFKFMTPQGIRIEWVIGNVELTAHGGSGFPGGESADCRHELGVISASGDNSVNLKDFELFRNNIGGFYVDVFYSGGNYPTQNITVSGNIRVVNRTHDGNGCDDEGCAGLETPVTFTLDSSVVNAITPARPLVVTIELDQTGWKVGFSLNANPVYAIADNHPGVSVDAHGKVVGGWDASSLADAAITNEFASGGFLWAMFQDVNNGNGTGSIDRVKACVGCTLVTDCPDPFADADQDGDVDLDDFAAFQACYTGLGGGIPANCRCFDHDASGSIDDADFTSFENCALASGPGVPVPKTCDDH